MSSFVVGQISNFIPEERVVDWTKAGLKEPVPPIENIINIAEYDSQGLIDAINSLDGTVMTLIQLSSGTYSLSQSITLKSNTIIKGSNSGATTELQFNNNDTSAIYIRPENLGSIIESKTIQNQTYLTKGSVLVEVLDISGLSVGDYIHLIFNSDNHHFHSTSAELISTYDPDLEFIGQMNQIKDINENFIELEDELRFDFSGLSNGRVRFIGSETVKNVGIEDLKITGNNCSWLLWFDWAANCWIRGVDSDTPEFSHIKCTHSSNIEITGNYIHHAVNYGGGGAAYGVHLLHQTTNVLVENNVFKRLRHAMELSHGANGNVFGYNYSFDQYSNTDSPPDSNYLGDVSLHGHFPFANLFEGNLFEFAFIDVWWGYSGPNNTFFRNRSKRRYDNDNNVREGFLIHWRNDFRNIYDETVTLNYEFPQSIVGNRFDYNDSMTTAFNIQQNNIGLDYIHNNKDCYGFGNDCQDYEDVLPEILGNSYYHQSQPMFLSSWPFDPENYQLLPAFERGDTPGNETVNSNRYLILKNSALSDDANLGGTLSLSIDNSIFDYEDIISGKEIQIPNYNLSVDTRTDNELLQGQKHLRWDDNDDKFLMNLNNYDLVQFSNSIEAKFDFQSSVTINSNLQNNIQLQIQDPWFVRENGTQTGNDWLDANGQYSVFLNQNDQFNESAPIYLLNTPLYVGKVNGIFQFTHWSGNDVLFNGNSTSNELQTNVVFLSSDAHVTANYDLNNPLNLQPGALIVPPDETLIIYADSDIPFASTTSYVDNPIDPMYIESEGFRLYVQGKLIVENNAKLKKSGNGKWGGIVLEPDGILELNGALIEDAFIGINIPDPGGNYLDTIYSKIKRCVFKDNSIALLYINNSNCGYSHPTVEINNNTFYNNEFTVFTHSFADPDECDIPKPSSNLKILMNNNIIANSTLFHELIDSMNYNFFFNTPVSDEIEALGEGNVENGTDPLFVDPQNGDYHLSFPSPCRDAGHPDLDGDGVMWQNDPDDQDPDGTRMDMGAFYYELPNTYLSFHPQMSVGDNPRLIWTPINVGEEIYYDIYYHIANNSSLIYLATTQSITYTDLRYIVTEIEQATNERRVKVKKNQLIPPEQATMRVYYTIVVRDGNGHLSPPSNEIMARVIRAPNPKGMEELLPEKYDLSQGYPNPFNPTITLPYALPNLSTVVIHVYDITGRRINTLKNEMQVAGYHKINWNGVNKSGQQLSSGMYIVQMTAKSMESGELFTKAQKIVLLK